MSTDFSHLAILQQNTGSVEAPKPPPIGKYTALVVSKEFGESRNKKTPFVSFGLKLLEPGADVNMEDFAAWGGAAKLATTKAKVDYYLTADALFRLTDMMKAIGLPDSATVQENISSMLNQTVIVDVKHRMSQDLKQAYMDIGDLLPVS